MKLSRLIILLALAIFISACSVVKSVNKLGGEHYKVSKEQWEGTWIAEDGALQIKVLKPDSGELQIMFIENGKLESYTLFLGRNGSDTYINFVENADDQFYYPAKFKKSNNQIIVWLLSTEMLKQAIINKEIDGKIIKQKYSDDILITASPEELNQYFTDNKQHMLFDYEEPLILRRLVK